MNKKIKLLVLFIVSIISTGCTANYNISVSKDIVKEELIVNNSGLSNETKEIYTTNALPVDINKPSFLDYDIEVKPNQVKKESGINYYDITSKGDSIFSKSTLKFSDYKNSRIANSFFNNLHVNNYADMFSIYGYNGITAFASYPNLDSVNINITTSMEVVDNNADKVDGNTYTWIFKKNNDINKTLYIEFNPKQVEVKENKKMGTFQILLIVFSLLIIIVLPIVYIRKSRKNYNNY